MVGGPRRRGAQSEKYRDSRILVVECFSASGLDGFLFQYDFRMALLVVATGFCVVAVVVVASK